MARRLPIHLLPKLALLALTVAASPAAGPADPPMAAMSAAPSPPKAEPAAPAPAPAPAAPSAFKAYNHDKPPRMADALVAADAEPFKPSASPQEAARGLDQIILAAATQKKLTPTPLIDDEAFLRRASIDLIGCIPTAAERKAFLNSPGAAAERRVALVRHLMASDRFVDRWTVFFDDLLRVRSGSEGGAALREGSALRTFIIESLRKRTPYDEMVRQMLTARGTLAAQPAVGFLASDDEGSPLAMPGVVTQEFLGIRMNCAQCHDHPFDSWTQQDYYNIAAFFGRTTVYRRDKSSRILRVGLGDKSSVKWPPHAEKDEATTVVAPLWPVPLLAQDDARVQLLAGHRAARVALSSPKVDAGDPGDVVEALASPPPAGEGKALGAGLDTDAEVNAKITGTDSDREQLAELITSPRNRYFAWSLVNRVWAELMGTGIVMPLDDFRPDNPPSNARLLTRLADEFVASGYDLNFIIEAIVSTEAYQRAHMAGPPERRTPAERAFVAAPIRRLNAEAIYDSLITAGHLESPKHPAGANMVEVTYTVEERRYRASAKGAGDGGAAATQPSATTRVIASYSAEEVDTQIVSALTQPAAMASMNGDSDMQRQAASESQMVEKANSDENVEYVTRTVKEMRDENPSFRLAAALTTPAPPEHMIRQFGQPGRATLGDRRDANPNMRQSLILLNGKLVNEAARVGEFEPMNRLMEASAKPEEAINLAYVEILSRRPTPKETAAGLAMISAAADRREGIADLRWVLLNSLEFRYVP